MHIGLGLQVLALDVGNDSLEAGAVGHFSSVTVLPAHLNVEIVTGENRLTNLVGQIAPRGIQVKVKIARETVEQFLVVVVEGLAL